MTRPRQLVTEHLEDVSAVLLEQYQSEVHEYTRGKHGIYALYKGSRLYYVGLATNLHRRMKQHLRDRHHGLWNRFSVYLTRRQEHIKDLESLVLRITKPEGNMQLGRIPGSTNLQRSLERDIKAKHKDELNFLVGGKRKPNRGSSIVAYPTAPPPLKPHITRGFAIRGTIDGEQVRGRVLRNGWVRYEGYEYFSPTDAAKAAVGARRSGWSFWRYQRATGEWVRLGEIRNED